ncbi:MAG TPA: rod shape-determining protein MreD [Chthonomonadaceae bacterium]|nr:rod shape-determining protein MreD [Chthonomonadaceae bacterium]
MNPTLRRRLICALALFLAALVQSAWADAMRFHGAKPDFLVLVALLGAMFCEANESAALGFFAGLLMACLAAPPTSGFGSLIVSRTLVAFGVGWLEERIFRDNALIAVIVAACGTALAEGLFFVFTPQHHIGHWLRGVGLTTLYNALLALPLYLLIRRCLGPRPRPDEF